MAEPNIINKRPLKELSTTDNLTTKKPHSSINNDDEIDIFSDEDLSKLLESAPETTPFSPFRVRFVPYPYLVLPFEHFSSYITINGNEESCGSSFSDSDSSSFMASFDYTSGGAWGTPREVARESEDDCDSVEVLLAAGFLAEQEGVFGSLEKKLEKSN